MADCIPNSSQMTEAVDIYLDCAYPDGGGPDRSRVVPSPEDDLFQWLMLGVAEPNPVDVPLAEVRRFALRLGNNRYPHMKLTLARHTSTAGAETWIYSVDSHDLMLHGRENHPDEIALVEQLKDHNRQVARSIHKRWEAAGLMTEHAFLRKQIARYGN